jgi:TatD DNase family protein
MLIVDSHCHLNYPEFTEDFPAVLARARDAGVGVMQTICTRMREFEDIHALTMAHNALYCSVGVHPHEAGKEPLVSVEELLACAARPKVIGIGETGLDYFYEHSPRKEQQASFRNHLLAASRSGLPVIIHTREAEEDTLAIMREMMQEAPYTGLIHCFTSSHAFAESAMELGMSISISGIVTFKSASALQESVRQIPLEKLLVETDAPYLAPNPKRGKRNEPSFTMYTNSFVANLKQVSEEECARITTTNFFALFTKAVRPQEAQAA